MKPIISMYALLVPSIVPAIAQIKSGDHVVIDEKVNDDLYVAGGNR